MFKRRRSKLIQITMLEESYIYKRLASNGTIKSDLNSYLQYLADCREFGFLEKDYSTLQKEAYRRFGLANQLVQEERK